MKKIWCLLLAAAMVTGAAQASHAVDFKAKGVWLASFQYGQNGNFTNGGHTGYDPSEDEFEARSRVRLVIDAVADENLSGQVYFEIGKSIWGKAEDPQGGMAMGADKNIVKLKRAFIDWRVPDTDLKLRMGIQGIGLPYMAMGGPTVFQSDVAAITASYVFNENAAMTAFWARPYNDNYVGNADGDQKNFMDNMDMAGLMVPLTFDGVKLTPWGMFASIGSNTFRNDSSKSYAYVGNKINGVNGGYALSGLFPLRADLLSHRIKVTEIRPGMVETEFSLVRFHGDQERADKTYTGVEPLTGADIAETIAWIVQLPAHMNVNDIVLMPAQQAGAYYTCRNTK